MRAFARRMMEASGMKAHEAKGAAGSGLGRAHPASRIAPCAGGCRERGQGRPTLSAIRASGREEASRTRRDAATRVSVPRAVVRGWLTAASVALLLSGCAAGSKPEPAEPPAPEYLPPKIEDVEFPMWRIDYVGPAYWIDNETVIFGGSQVRKGGPPKTYADLGIFIWKYKTGDVRKHANGSYLCYSNGYVKYSIETRDGDVRVFHVMAGKLGEEKLVQHVRIGRERKVLFETPELAAGEGRRENKFTCRMFDYKENKVPPGHKIDPLLAEHGYFDYGAGQSWSEHEGFYAEQVKLCRNKTRKCIPLFKPGPDGQRAPLKSWDVYAKGMRPIYSRYRDTYLLYGAKGTFWDYDESPYGMTRNIRHSRVPNPYPVYLVTGQGEVERRYIPAGPWFPPGKLALTRKGILHYNLLFTEDGRVIRIERGTGPGVPPAVSPDGCRVATSFTPPEEARPVTGTVAMWTGPVSGPSYLHVIDLCPEERTP